MSRSADGTILSWNQAAARMFGYSPEEAIGANIRILYPDAAPADHTGLAQRALHGEPVTNFPTRRRRKDGSEIDVEVTISPVKRVDGSVIGTSAIYTDITGRKRMETELRRLLEEHKQAEISARESRDRLRDLTSALQTIREEEKTRIARELHDELGGALTALKMDTAAITHELEAASDLALLQAALCQRLDGMKQLIDSTVMSVRRIAADLRPVMLDNLGLGPTLEWLTDGFAGRTGIRVERNIPDENLDVNGDSATAIFRIVQEALTNVVRHSGANEVTVEVIPNGGSVVVRVQDNGKGISEQDMRKVRSFGLAGMRERAYVLGGDLTIKQAPQGGTVIEAIIPAFGTTDDGNL